MTKLIIVAKITCSDVYHKIVVLIAIWYLTTSYIVNFIFLNYWP